MPKYRIRISPAAEDTFRTWLTAKMDSMVRDQSRRRSRYATIDQVLNGEQPYESLGYEDATNSVMPVTQSRVEGVASRIIDAFFAQRPLARFKEVTGRRTDTQLDYRKIARELTDWFDYAARRPDILNAQAVTESVVRDYIRYGIAAFKVVPTRIVRKTGRYVSDTETWEPDNEPRQVYDGPRWFYIAARDLVWLDGYGQDVESIPIVGHERRMTYNQALMLARRGDYDPEAVEKLKGLSRDPAEDELPNESLDYPLEDISVYELWVRYDVDGDGYEEDLIVDYEHTTGTILRLVYNTFDFRPIVIARLKPVRGTSADGHGVPDILRPTQKLIDLVANTMIDAGKSSARFVVLGRAGTPVGDLLEDTEAEIVNGTQLVTNNPETDMRAVPLGDPRVGTSLLPLLEALRRDANDLVGIGPAQLGDLSVAHRAAAFSIDALLKEGAMFTREASRRLAEAFGEATRSTIRILALTKAGQDVVYRVVGEDGMEVERMFTIVKDFTLDFAVHITLADPNNSPDAVVQRSMLIVQLVLSWLREMRDVVFAATSPQLPESTKIGLEYLAIASQHAIRMVVESTNELQDLSRIVVAFDKLLPALRQMSTQEELQAVRQQVDELQTTLAAQTVPGAQAPQGQEVNR